MMSGELRRYACANARARGLLASLLGRAALEALAATPTRRAMLDALAQTAYGAGAPVDDLDESAIGHRLASAGRALLACLRDPERAFVRHYLLRHEMENLKLVLRSVVHSLPWTRVQPFVLPLPGIATMSPERLAACRDVNQLVARLHETPYADALAAALHRFPVDGPFVLEVALELDFYERLWLAADTLQRPDAERARALLGVLFDMLNLGWLARYRRVLSPEETLNYTLRTGRWLTLDARRRLAEDAELPWEAALAGTPYARLLAGVPADGLDVAASALLRAVAREAQRSLRGEPFHIGVLLAVLLSIEIEIRDLRVLLAAKTMGVAPQEAPSLIASLRGASAMPTRFVAAGED
jgi:vacuolar-type H+-ATPase subunit C/Vma6